MKQITIAGGGLSGLAAGIALRARGVPVIIHEAGDLPRHRVCGEFIAGLDDRTIEALDLEPLLSDAPRHDEMLWHIAGREVGRSKLPQPAIGISRHTLDSRMGAAFARAGGELKLRSRAVFEPGAEGWLDATGRRASRGGWAGMKVHLAGFETRAPLEFHLGEGAYVGASAIENGAVNVCGLFKPPLSGTGSGIARMLGHLETCGLGELAARMRAATPLDGSFCAVAGLGFASWPTARQGPRVGDSAGMIPPFTGDGMAIALQGGVAAAAALAEYASESCGWAEAAARVSRVTRRRFAMRLGAAAVLHPFLTLRAGQASLAILHRAGIIPFGAVFNALH
jgi:flavin-dependent dehydrogenase